MHNLVIESIAVITAIVYLLLAAKEDLKCWYAAIISSSLYFYIMLNVGLLMEAFLQIFYIAMAIFGWYQWKKTTINNESLNISTWNKATHILAVTTVIILSILIGQFLDTNTNAELPFLDAFTTFGAIVTTYMVAMKILENWIYWFVIDSISIYLFITRELYLTSILFLIYLVIIVFGYFRWRKIFLTNPIVNNIKPNLIFD